MELLTPEEIRVLGSLIEKSLTTPENYPLTLNSLTLACNQKSARNPVVEYDQETIVIALNSLKHYGLINTETGGTSRTTKYRHTFASKYQTDPAETTAVGLLLLRGPLTVGEIKSNSGRMYEYDDLAEVQKVLDDLANREEPLVKALPRKPGQKEARYIHWFTEWVDYLDETPSEEPARKSVNEMEKRIADLEEKVAELQSKLENLLEQLA